MRNKIFVVYTVLWILAEIELSTPVSTVLDTSDEYDYNYVNDINFAEDENDDFSGEHGSGEMGK